MLHRIYYEFIEGGIVSVLQTLQFGREEIWAFVATIDEMDRLLIIHLYAHAK